MAPQFKEGVHSDSGKSKCLRSFSDHRSFWRPLELDLGAAVTIRFVLCNDAFREEINQKFREELYFRRQVP